MPGKIARHLRDTVIIIAISLGIFACGEIALRLAFPERVSKAYRFDENYIVALKPGVKKGFIHNEANGGQTIIWATNRDSFRGPELQPKPAHRIMVYGDSNMQARFSRYDHTYPARLAALLGKAGIPGVEAVNAGIIGFGPDQSLIRFTLEADKYRPDLVIFHFFADNDYGDVLRNALFHMDANGRLAKAAARPDLDADLIGYPGEGLANWLARLLMVRGAKTAFGFLRSDNRPKNTQQLLDLLWQMCSAEYINYKKRTGARYPCMADHYDIDIALEPERESSLLKIELAEKILRKADEFARAKGIKFLVLIQPSGCDVSRNRDLMNYTHLQKFKKYRRTNLVKPVERICLRHEIAYINLFDTFMANDPSSLYFRAGEYHWNDKGQRVAAEATAAYIVRHGMLSTDTPLSR